MVGTLAGGGENALVIAADGIALIGLVALASAAAPLARLARQTATRPGAAGWRVLRLAHGAALAICSVLVVAMLGGRVPLAGALPLAVVLVAGGGLLAATARLATMALPPAPLVHAGQGGWGTGTLGTALASAHRPGSPLSLLLVDIDHYQEVVGRLGPAAGSAAMEAISGALAARLRDCDRVIHPLGEGLPPDLFAIVCPDCDLPGALALGRRLRDAVARLEIILARGGDLTVTVSVGVADRRDGDSSDTLIARARSALDAARRDGRNRVSACAA